MAPRKKRERLSKKITKKPVALSDDEQSDYGDASMPVRTGPLTPGDEEDGDVDDVANSDTASAKSQDAGEEDEDEEEDDEDMFVVEAIKKHMIDEAGTIKFQVKWEGYDSKKDLTWEPEENLAESASEILNEYYDKIGGRNAIFEDTEKAARGKKRGRQASGAANAGTKRSRKNGHPGDSTPPATSQKWSPPTGSWEDDIDSIDACEEQGSGKKLVVFLNWKNGQKTKHDTSVIYKKCPQKMLQYYERHVKIIREENRALTDGTEN